MSDFKVDFSSMSWDDGRPGVRQKIFRSGTRQVRLVEFQTAEGFDGWCEEGHIGYVLEGGLQIDVRGELISFVKGDALFIPSGTATAHRAVTIVPGTRLFMTEGS
jgi:quercetin dioxygenase-like cupin family protein